MILLDTTFLIDTLRERKNIREKIEKLKGEILATTEVNVFETLVGIYSSKKTTMQKDMEAAYELFNRLNILPLERKGSHQAAQILGKLICEGRRIGELDCLTAGISLSHGITQIVTGNKSHFERVPGIKIIPYV